MVGSLACLIGTKHGLLVRTSTECLVQRPRKSVTHLDRMLGAETTEECQHPLQSDKIKEARDVSDFSASRCH